MKKYNLSTNGMKTLENSELEKFIENVNQLLNYPDSERIFSELHSLSLKILKEKGRNQLKFIPTLYYNYQNSEREIRLHLAYEKKLRDDKLDLMLYQAGKSLEFVMRRLRGYNLEKELASEDRISMLSKGKGIKYVFSKLLEYHPCALGIRENESQRIVKY